MFADRTDAGRRLAAVLGQLIGHDVVVTGLPRGGVPVALQVALALQAPLDVIVVRKLGVPARPEVAMGALGEGGIRVVDDEIVRAAGVTPAQFAGVEAAEQAVLAHRVQQWRVGRPRIPLAGREVVIVDDGIATGSTARAACLVARAEGATRIVLAAPVAPAEVVHRLADVADEVVCVITPRRFVGIGQFYADFDPTPDEEVTACLHASG